MTTFAFHGFCWREGSRSCVRWVVTAQAIARSGPGPLMRRVCAVDLGESSIASSIGPLTSRISMERSMGDLDSLRECSPDLGNISLNERMGECHILQSYGED